MGSKSAILQTAFLGDLLLSIPLIRNAQKVFGEKPILICRKGFGDFLSRSQLVADCIEIEKGESRTYDQAVARVGPVEFAISPHQSLRSARFVNKLASKRRVGFRAWWNSPFFDVRVERPMELPDGLRQLSLLRPLDESLNSRFEELEGKVSENPRFFLAERGGSELIPEWASMRVDYPRLNRFTKKNVFFAPGSVWNTKRWVAEKYSELGKRLVDRGYQVVLVGSPEEKAYCDSIAKGIPAATNIAGEPSLFELGSYLSEGGLMVSNDNGAMHLASTAGIPTVSIFGPTVLNFGYRPWNPKSIVVQTQGLSCRPCGKHGHQACPIGTHVCMKQIEVDQVLKATLELL